MADALTKEAPLTQKVKEVTLFGVKVKEGTNEFKYLSQVDDYDTSKKYVFQLADVVAEREKPVIDARTSRPIPHRQFIPYRNLVLSSQIVWNGSRTHIRYYDGCETIFTTAQPKEKDVIDQLIQQSKRRHFQDGKLVVDGYEKMLLLFLNICSTNGESPFRVKAANGVFIPVNPDAIATVETEKMDNIEKALELAKEASEEKMRIHANYLGIATKDYDSGNDLSVKEIRATYRKYALAHAVDFIKSYGNKSIEVKYYIDKALLDGTINNKLNPNMAAWKKSNSQICDISGLISNEAISERLFEFSQSEAGEEFLVQLKAIYN